MGPFPLLADCGPMHAFVWYLPISIWEASCSMEVVFVKKCLSESHKPGTPSTGVKRRCFKTPLVSLADKATLFQSLIATVLFHGAGTWTGIEGQHLDKLDAAMRQMACQMQAPTVSLADAWHLGHSQVLARVGLPSAATCLHVARLHYLLACVCLHVPELWALAHWERDWLATVRESVEWLWQQVDGGRHFPDWTKAWFEWRTECKTRPGCWKSRLRRALQAALQQERWQAYVEQHAGLLVRQIRRRGLCSPLTWCPSMIHRRCVPSAASFSKTSNHGLCMLLSDMAGFEKRGGWRKDCSVRAAFDTTPRPFACADIYTIRPFAGEALQASRTESTQRQGKAAGKRLRNTFFAPLPCRH